MATIKTLKEVETDQIIYPETSANAVFFDDGENLKNKMLELMSTKAKLKVFIDQWNEACGKHGFYNESTGYFELNGLTDITYEQALNIYRHYSPYTYYLTNYNFATTDIRTNIPIKGYGTVKADNIFLQNTKIEVANLSYDSHMEITNLTNTFGYCRKLKSIMPTMNAKTNCTFTQCYELENLQMAFIADTKVDLQWSPKVTLESFRYLVNGSNNITVTVHTDVYAKLTDTSNTEWHKVLTDAEEKNITFVTI